MDGSGQASSLVGQLLDGRYEILEAIGDGGVGMVYRARRVQLDRVLVVKVLHDSLIQDEGFVRRFQREAVAMSRLHHPHCVAVSDFGVHGSRPYLVLEYVPGENIRRLLTHGRFDPRRAVHIALQLLDALTYLHDHHVIHRDLKSENVMLTESSGAKDFVKVLDFGMAKILAGPGADSQLSKIGIVPGTPGVMAPEQIRQLPPDPGIDIYATGILLYEMIVGRRPFVSTDAAAVVKMQLSALPEPPRQILGEAALSAELEVIMIKALEKDRFDRFASAAEMADVLRQTPEGRGRAGLSQFSRRWRALSADTPAARPSTVPERARRGRWFAAAQIGAALVLGAVTAGLLRSRAAPKDDIPPVTMAAKPRSSPTPAPLPPPAPVIETWLAHRDLAVTYSQRAHLDAAFREIEAAIGENAAGAGTDPVLVDVAVMALTDERVEFVVDAFRGSPHLLDALAETTAKGATVALRHAAHRGLRLMGQEARADLVAMGILDVEQASKCGPMRAAYNRLRSQNDRRVQEFKADLRKRGRSDPRVRCLMHALRR